MRFYDWLTKTRKETPLALQLSALSHSVPKAKRIRSFSELVRIYSDKLKKNADDALPISELWRLWTDYCKESGYPRQENTQRKE